MIYIGCFLDCKRDNLWMCEMSKRGSCHSVEVLVWRNQCASQVVKLVSHDDVVSPAVKESLD